MRLENVFFLFLLSKIFCGNRTSSNAVSINEMGGIMITLITEEYHFCQPHIKCNTKYFSQNKLLMYMKLLRITSADSGITDQ
jgi:hypothetical protein